MAEITIIGPALSTYVRTARMVCHEKGVDYDLEPVEFGSEAVRRAHPFAKVPAFRHGDFTLYETSAIARYIDQIGSGRALVPADARAAARMEQWISGTSAYLYPTIITAIVLPRIGFVPADEAAIGEAATRAEHHLGVLDRALDRHDHLAGDELSLADFFPSPILFYFAMTPEGQAALPKVRNVGRWYERMAGRESFQATIPELPSS